VKDSEIRTNEISIRPRANMVGKKKRLKRLKDKGEECVGCESVDCGSKKGRCTKSWEEKKARLGKRREGRHASRRKEKKKHLNMKKPKGTL